MTLLSSDAVVQYLACPVCRSSLDRDSEGFRCSNPECRFAAPALFPDCAGQPILVDFGRSILSEEAAVNAAGSLTGPTKSRGFAKSLVEAAMPANLAAARNAERLIELTTKSGQRPVLLIVGGGNLGAGTEVFYKDDRVGVICFDLSASSLTHFVADAHQMPIADESVDAVWVQAVLEHVLDPWAVVSEIYRVLKPGGIVYAETPFMQQVHAGAYDFTRFTASGHRWMFRKFEEIDAGVALGPAAQFLWSLDYLVRATFRSARVGLMAKMLFSPVRYLDRLADPRIAFDGASALFFLGQKSDGELQPRDMVSYYPGRDHQS